MGTCPEVVSKVGFDRSEKSEGHASSLSARRLRMPPPARVIEPSRVTAAVAAQASLEDRGTRTYAVCGKPPRRAFVS